MSRTKSKSCCRKKAPYKLQITDYEKEKVYYFAFPGNADMGFNPSPPCLKLETFLKIAGSRYEVVKVRARIEAMALRVFPLSVRSLLLTCRSCSPQGSQHLLKAPKGKCPYIEFNGEVIGDSEIVITRLKVRTAAASMFRTLPP